MKADIAAGVGLTALGLVTTLGPDTVAWVDTLVMPAVTLPVIWRRRAPLACAAALAAGIVVSGFPTFDQVRCGFAIPAALLVLYAVGSRLDRSRALAGLALVLGGMVALTLTDSIIGPQDLEFIVPLCLGVFIAGRAVGANRRLARDLAAHTRELERQRERTAALAVTVERVRLGAQLDVAARDRARAMLALAEQVDVDDAAAAREAFGRIERLGRESLNEMRALLGALRSDELAVGGDGVHA